jgi:hypothetical protein
MPIEPVILDRDPPIRPREINPPRLPDAIDDFEIDRHDDDLRSHRTGISPLQNGMWGNGRLWTTEPAASVRKLAKFTGVSAADTHPRG